MYESVLPQIRRPDHNRFNKYPLSEPIAVKSPSGFLNDFIISDEGYSTGTTGVQICNFTQKLCQFMKFYPFDRNVRFYKLCLKQIEACFQTHFGKLSAADAAAGAAHLYLEQRASIQMELHEYL